MNGGVVGGVDDEGNVADVRALLRSGLRPAREGGGSIFAMGNEGAGPARSKSLWCGGAPNVHARLCAWVAPMGHETDGAMEVGRLRGGGGGGGGGWIAGEWESGGVNAWTVEWRGGVCGW